jgi:hypothetical protein
LARQPSNIFTLAWGRFGDSGIVLLRNTLSAATLLPLFGMLYRMRLRSLPALAVLFMALDPLLRQLHTIGESTITLAFFAWYAAALSCYLERYSRRAAGLLFGLAMFWAFADSAAWLGMLVHGLTTGAVILTSSRRHPVTRPVVTLVFVLLAGWSGVWLPLALDGIHTAGLPASNWKPIWDPMQRIAAFGFSDYLPLWAWLMACAVPRSKIGSRSASLQLLLVVPAVLITTGSPALVGIGVVSFAGRPIQRGMILAGAFIARQSTARRLQWLARVVLLHWLLTLMTVEPLSRYLQGIAPWHVGAYRAQAADPGHAMPVQALSVILREELQFELSTDTEWVPYLKWHLSPDLATVAELGALPGEDEKTSIRPEGSPLRDRFADIVLVKCDSEWDQLFAAEEGWCELYRDGLATLYARDLPRLQRVISRASDQLLLPPPLPAARRFAAPPLKFT